MEKKIKVTPTETVTPITETVISTKTPGRPVLPESKRQQRMLELEIKRQSGTVKKGRPASTDSKRQQRMLELAEKRKNGELKPGRPKYTAEEKEAANEIKKQRKAAEKLKIEELAKAEVAKMQPA